jgi:hypothetical protein
VPTFGPWMVCAICGIIGAGARPNWSEDGAWDLSIARTARAADELGKSQEIDMLDSLKFGIVALVCIGIGTTSGSASAITVEVAKKCAALTAKAFPPRMAGNPAAGIAKGTGQSEQSYFSKCVASGGNVDESGVPTPPERPR